MNDEFIVQMKRAAEKIFRNTRVLAAYAYGSRIAGNYLPESDLDIGYYPFHYKQTKQLSISAEMMLAADLSDELELNVDLRNLNDAPLELKGKVLEEGIRIYSADEAKRIALETYILKRYHDCKEAYIRMHEVRLKNYKHFRENRNG